MTNKKDKAECILNALFYCTRIIKTVVNVLHVKDEANIYFTKIHNYHR